MCPQSGPSRFGDPGCCFATPRGARPHKRGRRRLQHRVDSIRRGYALVLVRAFTGRTGLPTSHNAQETITVEERDVPTPLGALEPTSGLALRVAAEQGHGKGDEEDARPEMHRRSGGGNAQGCRPPLLERTGWVSPSTSAPNSAQVSTSHVTSQHVAHGTLELLRHVAGASRSKLSRTHAL